MTDNATYDRPVPFPDLDDEKFWNGCKEHQLLIQRCTACGALRFWDRPMCLECHSMESEAIPASGRGTIWSYTTTYRTQNRAWNRIAEESPYVIVVVDLDEGPRITSNLVDDTGELLKDVGQFRIGDAVEVSFADVTPEFTLPRFRLAT